MSDKPIADAPGVEEAAESAIRSPFYSAHLGRQYFEYKQREARLAFTGVTARAFPLKASLNKLQDFCDGYLNFADDRRPAPFYFKPAIPFVYLQMINYGEMATLSENLGWIAQEEVLFAMPVEWYDVDVDSGKMTFRDWALVCPYVFVDNDISQRTGREVYGWTKTRASLNRLYSSWTQDPRWRRQLMEMRTLLFPGAYEGEMLTPRTLIEVLEEPSPSLFRSPLAERDLFNPLWSWPTAMRNGIEAMMDTAAFVSALPIFGYDQPRSAESASGMLRKALGNSRGVLPWITARNPAQNEALERAQQNPYLNQVTLKQFRDAEYPDQACYQALVNSKISIDHFHEGGLMGGPHVLAGDLSGGYRIKVHDYAEQRMVDTLGIQVDSTTIGEHGQKVFELVPRLPFWTSVDLRYDTGQRIHWRSKNSSWTPGISQRSRGKCDAENAYNVTRGAANQESYGPFGFPDMTVRVLPLRANKDRLEQFCHGYLNTLLGEAEAKETGAAGIRPTHFEPWGDRVFVTVTTYGGEYGAGSSTVDGIGQIGLRRVAFNVPVRHSYTDAEGATHTRTGIISPWVFNSSSRQTLSEREVNGVEAHHAMIDCDDQSWLAPSGPAAPRTLLTLKRLMMIGQNAGQKAQMRPLMEIREHIVNPDLDAPPDQSGETPASQPPKYSDEQIQEALHCLSGRLDYYSLKQFRNTGDMSEACYQALVVVQRQITRLYSHKDGDMYSLEQIVSQGLSGMSFAQPLGNDIWLSLHDSPFWPIVDTLGLHHDNHRHEPGSMPIYDLRADQPFFMRLSLHEHLGKNLMARTHHDDWEFGEFANPPGAAVQGALEPMDIFRCLLAKEREPGGQP